MLSALVLAAGLSGGPLPASDAPGFARVLVERGRARVATHEGVSVLGPDAPWETVPGGAHLEVGYGSRVRVAWPGRASLDLTGPLTLEWLPPWTDGSHLGWSVRGSGTLHVEVRRGPVDVRLPASAWSIRAHAAAFAVRGLPGGAAVVEHAAGAPLEVAGTRPDGGTGRAVKVRQGDAVRLKARR